jgi:hypothetical protein
LPNCIHAKKFFENVVKGVFIKFTISDQKA